MAIKDIIGPGFVGTTTIKWIVTRGLSIGASEVPGDITSMPHTVAARVFGPQKISGGVSGPNMIAAHTDGPQTVHVKDT